MLPENRSIENIFCSQSFWHRGYSRFMEKQAENPLPSGVGMNAVPNAVELKAKSISS